MNLKDFSKSYFTKTDSPHHRVTDGKTSNFPLLSRIEFLLNLLRFLKKSRNLCLIICVEFVKSKFSPPAKASGSGSAPEGLLPRRESLWLGEGRCIGIITTPTIHKIPLIPPLPKEEIVIPLFGKEGRGEIF